MCFLVSVASLISCFCRLHKRRKTKSGSNKDIYPVIVNANLVSPTGLNTSEDSQKYGQGDIELGRSLQRSEENNNQNQQRFNELENSFESYDDEDEDNDPDAETQSSYENILKKNEATGFVIPLVNDTYAQNNISFQQEWSARELNCH